MIISVAQGTFEKIGLISHHSIFFKVMLMWHGSGLQNFVGILSQGLRIAPKEAPCSGYNFGKGIYFADCWEKSIQYCRGGNLMLLCEVYLGESEFLHIFFLKEIN